MLWERSRVSRALVVTGFMTIIVGHARAEAENCPTPKDEIATDRPDVTNSSVVAPAVKWQISPVPGKFDVSVTAGIFLPTGDARIAGSGAQPYLQLPWSWELHDGWGLSGMFTEFFRPTELTTRRVTETTFVIEKKLTEKLSLFTEYVGDYPEATGPIVLLNSGGMYRFTHNQQVDFHVAFGLNHNSPSYTLGVGYSFRVDGLFAAK